MGNKSDKSGEPLSLDLDSAKRVLQKLNRKEVIVPILIIVPMLLAIFFRVQPAYLPVTDQWAQNAVMNGVQNNIRQQVDQQYPNLPPQQKQELVQQQMNQMRQQQGGQFQQQIKSTSNRFKERLRTDDGQTYLLAIDPYQWYRYFENQVETGHQWDVLKNGQPWNNHKIAPLGAPFRGTSLHVSFSYWIYGLVSFFNSDIPPMTTFFFIPVLVSALAVIPAFFLARKKAGNFGGFMAATLLAVHSSFLGRTAAGFSDTDPYNVFFPLLITWLFIEAFESDNVKHKSVLISLAGLTTGIFSAFWGGWWYIFDFLIVILAAYIGYVVLREIVEHKIDLKKIFSSSQVKSTLGVGTLFVATSGVFVSLFNSFSTFLQAPLNPIRFTVIKQAAHENLWPNVYTTVAELGDTGLGRIVGSMGGKLLFFIAMLGVVMTLINKEDLSKKDLAVLCMGALIYILLVTDKFLGMDQILYLFILALPLAIGVLLTLKDKRGIDIKYALFLTVWFIGTIYATTKGVRFTLLLVPALAVSFGIALGIIKDIFSRWMSSEMNMNPQWSSLAVMVVMMLLLLAPLQSASAAAKREVPSMSDAWWNSLTKIRQESEPDAIINSWWDFGHWFKAIGDRAVTFDGGSQNTPMAHWVGKTLLTGDEDTAVGILRMLDCGSNLAFEHTFNVTNDTVDSVELLNDIIVQDREAARQRLQQEGFTEQNISDVLSRTHCDPPENYFITSSDMIGKSGVWAHFGSWSFERAHIYENLRNEDPRKAIDYMVENFGYSEDKAQRLYNKALTLQSSNAVNSWIAPWPSYVMNNWNGCSDRNETIVCNLGMSLGQNQGQHTVIEQVVINKTDVNESMVQFGAYDAQSRQRLGGSTEKPGKVVLAGEESMEAYQLGGRFPYSILVDTARDNPRVMIMQSPLAESTFTKLYYLDGRYMEHFDKFDNRRSTTGQRIKVWKVDWEGNRAE